MTRNCQTAAFADDGREKHHTPYAVRHERVPKGGQHLRRKGCLSSSEFSTYPELKKSHMAQKGRNAEQHMRCVTDRIYRKGTDRYVDVESVVNGFADVRSIAPRGSGKHRGLGRHHFFLFFPFDNQQTTNSRAKSKKNWQKNAWET